MDIFPARGMDIDLGKLPVKPIVIIAYRVTYSVAYWVSNAGGKGGGKTTKAATGSEVLLPLKPGEKEGGKKEF